MIQAAAALNGEIRTRATAIRPEVALLVAERRDESVVVFSPGGTVDPVGARGGRGGGRSSGPDRLAPRPARRPSATTGASAATRSRGLSGYDALAANALDASVESLDATAAVIRLKGEIRGAALGGEGTIACEGTLRFDRAAGQIVRLDVTRHETRKAGPVEEGLDINSTLTVERKADRHPCRACRRGHRRLPPRPRPAARALDPDRARRQVHPQARPRLAHLLGRHPADRPEAARSRRGGRAVQPQRRSEGPPGKHQHPDQFRDDVRRALGARFDQFVGAGEVDGDPAGGFRYKVAVQGRQGDVGILWDYYLIASPDGDQLLATFTHAVAQEPAFGDQDVRLVASFRWTLPASDPATPAEAGVDPRTHWPQVSGIHLFADGPSLIQTRVWLRGEDRVPGAAGPARSGFQWTTISLPRRS